MKYSSKNLITALSLVFLVCLLSNPIATQAQFIASISGIYGDHEGNGLNVGALYSWRESHRSGIDLGYWFTDNPQGVNYVHTDVLAVHHFDLFDIGSINVYGLASLGYQFRRVSFKSLGEKYVSTDSNFASGLGMGMNLNMERFSIFVEPTWWATGLNDWSLRYGIRAALFKN